LFKISEEESKECKKYFGVIYMIIDKTNNKIYVGQTRDILNRLRQYRYESKKLTKRNINRDIGIALYEKGEKNFECVILEKCNSLVDLNMKEIKWIEKLDSKNVEKGYNMGIGGEAYENKRGIKLTWEERLKKSIPIVVYEDGQFKYYEGSKLFASIIGVDRTHITRAIKKELKLKSILFFIMRKISVTTLLLKLKEIYIIEKRF